MDSSNHNSKTNKVTEGSISVNDATVLGITRPKEKLSTKIVFACLLIPKFQKFVLRDSAFIQISFPFLSLFSYYLSIKFLHF